MHSCAFFCPLTAEIRRMAQSALLETMLEKFQVAYSELEQAALAKISPTDEEGLARVVRMAAANRELRKHGLPPLLVLDDAAADTATTNNDTDNNGCIIARHFGFSNEEVCAMQVADDIT